MDGVSIQAGDRVKYVGPKYMSFRGETVLEPGKIYTVEKTQGKYYVFLKEHPKNLYTTGKDFEKVASLSEPEPTPKQSESPAIWGLVFKDMKDRDASGLEKYGTRLQANNGRNALVDAYQEALDLAVYLRQGIYEKEGK